MVFFFGKHETLEVLHVTINPIVDLFYVKCDFKYKYAIT